MTEFAARHPRTLIAGGLTLALGLALAAFGGCGGGPETHDLSGTVTSGGRPVTWGTVTVIGSDNQPYSAPIRPDGTYTVAGLPPGPVRVAVTSPNPQVVVGGPAAAPGGAAARPKTAGARGVASPGAASPAGTAAANGAMNIPKGSRIRALGVEADLPPPPPAGAPAAAPPGQWRPLPSRYGNPTTSGLTATVGSGQPFDIRAD